jgi:ABC-2 type transport system ATP-binding protein
LEAITVQNLKKTYRTRNSEVLALDGITFSVPRGSIFGFLGPNGAGKSTTIGIMLQFLRQDAGEVFIFDQNVKNNLTQLKADLGFIPDADLPNISGLTLLKHTGKYHGLRGQQLRQKINEIVKLTESRPFVTRNTKKLSKGQKSRIKIANSLISDPELIIADEPTSGLDPVARRQYLQLISNLAKNEGKTIFFSNHVIGEVEKICDKLVILSKGKIITQGSIQDILKLLPVSNRYIITVEKVLREELLNLSQVKNVEALTGNRYVIETEEENDNTPIFIKELINDSKSVVHSFSRDNVNLEDIFFQVIGKEEK